MHFQYLVGLCCLRCNPDAIEMVIGDRVHDASSETERDVDVTIRFPENDGTNTAFMAYEARIEKGALDVADVEQLCAKLNDMPDLTSRAIVSATGFSKAAIKKAAAKNVKLYEFRDWTQNVKDGFPELDLVGSAKESLPFAQTEFRWVSLTIQVNPEDPKRDGYFPSICQEMKLFQKDGQPHPLHPTFRDFIDAITKPLSIHLSKTPEARAVLLAPLPYPPHQRPDGPVGDPVHFPKIVTPIGDPPYLQGPDGLVPIELLVFDAHLQMHFQRIAADYRILTEVGTNDVFAAAAIRQHPGHENILMSMTMVPENSLAHIRIIRLTDKQMNFIHKLKVRA